MKLAVSQVRRLINESLTFALAETLAKFDQVTNDQVQWNQLLDLLSANLEVLGEGTERITFALDDSKVLKVDVSCADHAQNLAEIKVASKPINWPFCARVYESDPRGAWLIMERVMPLHGEKLVDATGWHAGDLQEFLGGGELDYDDPHSPEERKFAQGLISFIERNRLDYYELASTLQLGQRADGQVIFYDIGKM